MFLSPNKKTTLPGGCWFLLPDFYFSIFGCYIPGSLGKFNSGDFWQFRVPGKPGFCLLGWKSGDLGTLFIHQSPGK